MDNPHMMALAVVGITVSFTSVLAGWMIFWGWLSKYQWWGFAVAFSPVLIGFYFLLVWRFSV